MGVKMNEVIAGLMGAAGLPVLFYLVNLFLPNEKVEQFGEFLGKAMTTFGRKKLGKSYEGLESRFQNTLKHLIIGLNRGADSDD